jgi:curved DNA-binding protein CbpA
VKDLYAILEVSRTASPEVIRAAYRAIAKRFHPDNNETGDRAKFLVCKEAHDILTDEAKRAVYDAQTNGHHSNGHQANGHQPQSRPVWKNGIGWVIVEDPGPYPGDPPIQYPQGPQPFPGQSLEDMMREAAAGIGQNVIEMFLYNLRTGGRR